MDLVAAERSRRIAKEDLAQMLEVELPTARKAVDFSLQMSADSLAYEKEELRQLEKMYKADDLTEETEEIVLRRAGIPFAAPSSSTSWPSCVTTRR